MRGNQKTREAIGVEQDKLKGGSYMAERMWLHWIHARWHYFPCWSRSKSINLLEVRGLHKTGFWRVVQGGWMIDGWCRVLLSLKAWICSGTSPHSAGIFSGKVQPFGMRREQGVLLNWLGILRQMSSVGKTSGNTRTSGGSSVTVRTLSWVVQQGGAFILTLCKIMTMFPNAYHLVQFRA